MFDFHVHVWDAGTGAALANLETENSYVAKVLFSPDGATLAAVSDRGRHIHLWETSTWRLRRRLRFGVDWQFPGAFSPDGWRLAAGAGNAVAYWDLSTGGRIRGPAATLAGGHRAPVRALAFFPDGRRIVSAGFDGAAVVWDLGALATSQPAPPREPLTPTQLEQLWADLAVEDAARSYAAIWTLASAPRQAVEFLGKRLDPGDPVDEQQVRRWLRALDDDDFLARERATKELGRLGDAAEPFLREALAGKPSIEVSQRVEALLAAIAPSSTPTRCARCGRWRRWSVPPRQRPKRGPSWKPSPTAAPPAQRSSAAPSPPSRGSMRSNACAGRTRFSTAPTSGGASGTA
jgi:hypothetical protein